MVITSESLPNAPEGDRGSEPEAKYNCDTNSGSWGQEKNHALRVAADSGVSADKSMLNCGEGPVLCSRLCVIDIMDNCFYIPDACCSCAIRGMPKLVITVRRSLLMSA